MISSKSYAHPTALVTSSNFSVLHGCGGHIDEQQPPPPPSDHIIHRFYSPNVTLALLPKITNSQLLLGNVKTGHKPDAEREAEQSQGATAYRNKHSDEGKVCLLTQDSCLIPSP